MEMVLTNPAYRPGHLVDVLLEKLGLTTDAALAQRLEVTPTVISKIRNRRIPLSAGMLVGLAEMSGLSVGALRELAGLPRRMFIGA